MFCQFMDQCTENYECIVVANGVQSNKLDDQVFWYKATDHPPFRMCDDSLWANNHPFSSTMLAGEDFDLSKVEKKSAGPKVWVKKGQ
jgi:hypothetical protein